MSDFPQVAYVLAFDPPYVENALEAAGVTGGRSYLDKIVQVRVPLPPIGLPQISKLVDREVDTLEIDTSLQELFDDKDRIPAVYHGSVKFLLRTPRDVCRVFNRVRLMYPAIKRDVGLADFLALETIAITAPPLYNHIRERPEAYAGPLELEVFEKPDEVVGKLKDERREALDACPASTREVLAELVSRLFPLTTGSSHGGREPFHRTSGRIANSRNLLLALSGGLPSEELPLAKVRAFVERAEDRRSIAEDVSGQLEDFLDLLRRQMRLSPVADVEELVAELAYIGEMEAVEEAKRKPRFLKTDIATQIFWILRVLLEAQSSKNRRALIETVLESPSMMVLSADLLKCLRWQQGIPDQEVRRPESEWFVTAEELDGLTAIWTRAIQREFSSRSGWSSNEAGPALFLLRSIDGSLARELVKARLQGGPACQDEVAFTIGSGNWDSDKGRFARLSEEELGRFADVEEMRAIAVQRLADEELAPDLRAIYTSVLNGTKEYFCDHIPRE